MMNIQVEMGSMIVACLTALSFLVGIVVWLVRLEGKHNKSIAIQNSNQKHNDERILKLTRDMENLENRIVNFDAKIVDKLSTIEKMVAKIEGRLSIDNER